MKAEVITKSYCITMTTDQFADIMDRDEAVGVPLYTRIKDLDPSISKVHYDRPGEGRYFGPHIFITIEVDELEFLVNVNEEEILKNVINLVEEYIK